MMKKPTVYATAALVSVGVLLSTAACGNNDSSSPSSATTASSAASAADSTTQESGPHPSVEAGGTETEKPATQDSTTKYPECSGLTAQEAWAKWAGDVPDDSRLSEPWDRSRPHASVYDECAPLSWMIIGLEGPTASSPYHIMLFHNGQYLGTATAEAQAFYPDVSRVSDSEIAVTYHWPKPGEGNAERSGESIAHFRWDEDAQKVVMTGDLPPQP